MATLQTRTKHQLFGFLFAVVVAVGVLALTPPSAQAQTPPAPNIDKECTPHPVGVGQQLTCLIVVEAASDNTTGGVRVIDTLPDSVRVTQATSVQRQGDLDRPVQCDVTGNTVTCPPPGDPLIGIANAGPIVQSFRVTIKATTVQCGTFTNIARAEGEIGIADPFTGITPFTPVEATEEFTVVGCQGLDKDKKKHKKKKHHKKPQHKKHKGGGGGISQSSNQG